jgi:hypothetical protein
MRRANKRIFRRYPELQVFKRVFKAPDDEIERISLMKSCVN